MCALEDELIREVTINCAERGLLLLRVRDEIRMTIAAYQTLYESSVAFGMRKALQAEQGKSDMERKVSGVDHEASALCEPFCQSQGHRVVIPDEILASEGALALPSVGTPGFRVCWPAWCRQSPLLEDVPCQSLTSHWVAAQTLAMSGCTAVSRDPSTQALTPPSPLGSVPG